MNAISKQDSISVRPRIVCTNCNKSNHIDSQINNTNINERTKTLTCPPQSADP